MKIEFTYYLHEDCSTVELLELILGKLPNSVLGGLTSDKNEELYEKMRAQGNPFYEVTLNCVLDTDTGEITLVSAKL